MASIVVNNRSSIVTDPIRNFRFLVTFQALDTKTATKPNLPTFGFTSLSGLTVQTDSIPYREGGYNTTVHQIPGQSVFSPVTFQRGVALGDRASWEWMKRLFRVTQGATDPTLTEFRCDIEIKVLSHPISAAVDTDPNKANGQHVAMRFKIYNAWVTSVAYSDLNAGDNALFVEQMSVVHEGFDVHFADNYNVSATNF